MALSHDKQMMRGGALTMILRALEKQPLGAAQLARSIRKQSGGIFFLGQGEVDTLLKDLRRKGLVHGDWSRDEAGKRCRVHGLTQKGERMLDERLAQWRLFARGMRMALGEQ
jgi:DNA-binding PadR family transcriptional regulator